MPLKQAQLDKLQEKIIKSDVTPELRKQATQLVFGVGNPDAAIVFIGEAPGKNEDIQGEPFVGAAGKFLNEMLAMIGLERKNIYITNIVKYRPPGNRDPIPEEKAAFLPYLQAQLGIIQPKIVVTLGRHSMNCFLPDLQISKVHGQPKRIRWILERSGGQDADGVQGGADQAQMARGLDAAHGSSEERSKAYKGVRRTSTGAADKAQRQEVLEPDELGPAESRAVPLVILPLFHPAAALYNGAMRQTLIDDFMRIPAILEKLKDKPTKAKAKKD